MVVDDVSHRTFMVILNLATALNEGKLLKDKLTLTGRAKENSACVAPRLGNPG